MSKNKIFIVRTFRFITLQVKNQKLQKRIPIITTFQDLFWDFENMKSTIKWSKNKIFIVRTFRFITVASKSLKSSKHRIPIITTFQDLFWDFENRKSTIKWSKNKIFIVRTFRFIKVTSKKLETCPYVPIYKSCKNVLNTEFQLSQHFKTYFGTLKKNTIKWSKNKIFLVRTFRFITVASKKSETFQTLNSNYHNISRPILKL
ncbi:hypothetical protein Avbf_15934 [Armadillidium vulgare]|nr:hypothetical protein Avbf_15934 [Armadillidium vulgare]